MNPRYNIMRDLAIIFLSAVLSVVIVKTQALDSVLAASGSLRLMSSFLAGVFFTSVFTTPLAAVVLAQIAKTNGIFVVALLGALGALVGDLLIFRFIRYDIADDLRHLLTKKQTERWSHIMHLKLFHFLTPLLGGLIIASPLPDEIGIAMMGLSDVSTSLFMPVSFFFNFLGIIVVGFVAKSFS